MLPEAFVTWERRSPVLDRLGDFRRHRDEPGVFGFLVDEPKLNARGFLHGGVISTLADVCIGHSLVNATDPPTMLVTVNLNANFVGSCQAGEWVDVVVRIDRIGGRIAAGTAEFCAGERLVARATAMFIRSSP